MFTFIKNILPMYMIQQNLSLNTGFWQTLTLERFVPNFWVVCLNCEVLLKLNLAETSIWRTAPKNLLHKSTLIKRTFSVSEIPNLNKADTIFYITKLTFCLINDMSSRRSAIERCPSPQNQIRFCPIVTDNGPVKGNDILLIQILCSKNWKSVNIIALHWPVICYYLAKRYLVLQRRASLDRRSTTPHVFTSEGFRKRL